MSLTKKTISGALVRIVSLVTKGILQLAVLSFFTRFLTPGEFGIVNIVTALLVFIVLFTEIGLGPALIQKMDISHRHVSTAFISSVIFSVLIYLLLYIFSPLIAHFYHEPALTPVIRLAGLSFVISGIGLVPASLMRKELEFRKLMYIDISAFVMSYCMIGVWMALNGYGIWSYIVSIVTQSVFTSIFLLLSKPGGIRIGFYKKEFYELFHFAGALTFEKLFNTIGRQGDIFTTGKLLGMGSLGIYGRANQLMDIPNQYLGQALDNVLFPAMSKKQNDREVLASTYLKGVAIINLFLIPFSLYIILYAPEIIDIVFGSQWKNAVLILQILSLVLPFKTSVKVTDSLVRAMGAFYPAARIKFIYAVSVILLTVTGSIYGLEGIAIGVNISVMINYILMTRLAGKLTRFHPQAYYKTYTGGLMLAALVLILSIPMRYLLQHYTEFSSAGRLGMASLYTGSFLCYLLFFHPRAIGPNWEFLFSHLIGFIPSGSKQTAGIKIYFLKKITS